MRIKVLHKPLTGSIDGIRLEGFLPGLVYEVGNVVGALLLVQGWAAPVSDDEPASVASFSTAPNSNLSAVSEPIPDPANLIRELTPPSRAHLSTVADHAKRRARKRRAK